MHRGAKISDLATSWWGSPVFLVRCFVSSQGFIPLDSSCLECRKMAFLGDVMDFFNVVQK